MQATKTKDAVALLKEDHKKVKGLFDQFEAASPKEQQEIAQEVIQELKVHSAIEEEIFYPAVQAALKEKDQDIIKEAEEEHRVAKSILEALEELGQQDKNFEAKFIVLAENVRHHIKEEENEMFEQAKKAKVDLEGLGEQMMSRKEELMSDETALEQAVEASKIKPYQEL